MRCLWLSLVFASILGNAQWASLEGRDGIENGDVVLMASSWQTTRSTILQFQCFLLSPESNGTLSSENPGEQCCNAIHHALEYWNTRHQLPLQNDDAHGTCRDQMASTRLPDLTLDEASHWILPSLLFVTELFDTSRSPSSVVSPSMVWRYLVWDEEGRTGVWIDTNTTGTTPTPLLERFLSSYDLIDSLPGSQSLTFRGKMNSSEAEQEPRFHVNVTSVLSEEGGMHRRLHHELRMLLPVPVNFRNASSTKFSIWIVVHIPSGLFINVEDAFQVGDKQDATTTIDLMTHPHIVIDQEEPSFVSPSHTILYRVQGTYVYPNDMGDEWRFHWDTLLHIRYPEPLQTETDSPPWITLLSPAVVAVAEEFQNVEGTLLWKQQSFVSAIQGPIQFQVATGYAFDLIPVLLVTITTSLIGTVFLLRGMAVAIS